METPLGRQRAAGVALRMAKKASRGVFAGEGLDDLVLRGWRKVERTDELTGETLHFFVGPEGQTCSSVNEVFEQHQAAQRLCKLPQHKLSFVQALLKQHAVQEDLADPDAQDSGAATNLRSFQETGRAPRRVGLFAGAISRSSEHICPCNPEWESWGSIVSFLVR